MTIQIERLKRFAECPRSYYFTRDLEPTPVPLRHIMIESIMKEAYLQAMETGYRMDWKRIVTLVDAEVFSDIDVSDPEKFEHAKQLAGYLLQSLLKWYNESYITCSLETFVDISIRKVVCKQPLIAKIPIIQIGGETPTVTIITDIPLTVSKLYNDLIVRTMAWLVQTELGCDDVRCIGMSAGPKGSFESVTAFVTKEDHLRTEQVVEQIVASIVRGVNYPASGDRCGQCSFVGRCKL